MSNLFTINNRSRSRFIALILTASIILSLTIAFTPQAQMEKPIKLSFEVMMPEYDPVRIRAGELLAEYAKQLGIEIKVRPVDLNYEITKVRDEHDFDLYILGFSARNMPFYISDHIKSANDRPGGNNMEGIRNATLDQLAEMLDSTVDRQKQIEILWKIQEILADIVPWVGIYTRYLTQVWRVEWQGFHKEYWGYASPMTWRNAHIPGKEGGVFRVILADDLKSENVHLEGSIYEDMVWDALYDTLVFLDDSYSPQPWLAERFEVSSDGKVWTFYLVKNATFHDGKPITARDVKFTFDYIKNNDIPGYSNIARYYVKSEVIDDYTVRIYLNTPYAWFLYDLADVPIIPEHVWKDVAWNTSVAPKIGSGPFKWNRRVEGEYVELVKYENYWRSDMPKVDKLVFRIIKNFNAALLAMEAGEADFYVYYIPVGAVDRVKNNPELHLNLERGFTFYYLGFNMRKPPLDDVWLRRAFAYLLPKDEVVKGPLQGLGEPVTWYISPYFGDFNNPNVPEKFPWIASTSANVEKAREMLAMSDKYEYRDVDDDGILEAIPKKMERQPQPREKPKTETPMQTMTETEKMMVETKTIVRTQVVTKVETVTETVVQGPSTTDIALPVVIAVIVTAALTYILARRRS